MVVRMNAFIVGGVFEVDYSAAGEFLYVFIEKCFWQLHQMKPATRFFESVT